MNEQTKKKILFCSSKSAIGVLLNFLQKKKRKTSKNLKDQIFSCKQNKKKKKENLHLLKKLNRENY